MSAPRPAHDPVQVVQLLAGTLFGCISLGPFYWLWGIAWLIPGVLAVALLPWQRTRWVGIGFAAAAVGGCVAVMTVLSIPADVYVWTPPNPPPPSTPAPNPAAGSVTGDSPAWLPGDTSFARL